MRTRSPPTGGDPGTGGRPWSGRPWSGRPWGGAEPAGRGLSPAGRRPWGGAGAACARQARCLREAASPAVLSRARTICPGLPETLPAPLAATSITRRDGGPRIAGRRRPRPTPASGIAPAVIRPAADAPGSSEDPAAKRSACTCKGLLLGTRRTWDPDFPPPVQGDAPHGVPGDGLDGGSPCPSIAARVACRRPCRGERQLVA